MFAGGLAVGLPTRACGQASAEAILGSAEPQRLRRRLAAPQQRLTCSASSQHVRRLQPVTETSLRSPENNQPLIIVRVEVGGRSRWHSCHQQCSSLNHPLSFSSNFPIIAPLKPPALPMPPARTHAHAPIHLLSLRLQPPVTSVRCARPAVAITAVESLAIALQFARTGGAP